MHAGNGLLSFLGFAGEVSYELPVKAIASKLMPAGVRGALTLPAETARESFKAGEATLKLDDGKSCRIVMVGHTEGSDRAYFQTVG
jgi:hypothetical protein